MRVMGGGQAGSPPLKIHLVNVPPRFLPHLRSIPLKIPPSFEGGWGGGGMSGEEGMNIHHH